MCDSALGTLEISAVLPDREPPAETLILRECIRQVLRRIARPKADVQYN